MSRNKEFKIEDRPIWTPEQLALYILSEDFKYAFCANVAAIRERFNLKAGEKHLKRVMRKPEYINTLIKEFINFAKKEQTIKNKFWALAELYYLQNMNTDKITQGAMEFFGILSGEYDPKPSSQTNVAIITEEQRKLFKEIGKAAIENRLKRLNEN